MSVLKSLFSLALWVAAIALTAGAVLKLFFIDVIVLGHDAMAPTLTVREQAFSWRGAEPDLGDIAVCANPSRPAELVIGRVVGRPGHVVSSSRGRLTINGRAVDTDILGSTRHSVSTTGRIADVQRVVETLAGRQHEAFYPEGLALEI
ncbi:MAG: hypothetical protein H5U40_14520, partial [Polyangiaceae bacterium]|nr:hypothetical protein [Polyangiaceae bacterium]